MEEKIVGNQDLNIVQRVLQYKRYIIVALGITTLIILLAFAYLVVIASSNKIYSNVKVMDVNVGGLEKVEARKKLNDYYSHIKNSKLLLKVGEHQEEVKFNELGVIYDFDKAVESAYNLENKGGMFKRLFNIAIINFKGRNIDLPLVYDSNVLYKKLKQLENEESEQVKDDVYEIKNDRLVIHYGHSGKGIDNELAIKQIEEKIKKGLNDEVTFKETILNPKSLSADSISADPKDALYKVINFREVEYMPEIYGAKFDKRLFDELYKENKGKEGFSMSVETVRPKLTLNELKSKLFIDNLASHHTYFGSSTQSRKHNIELAASKIGGILLGPGDEFSYNAIVGPRTADRGFQMAHVYSNGKVIDDYGGGICQVSSALYSAALKADLEVTSRKNHMFTVGYAQPGLDATVNYGSIDFKFKNNKPWPIKIVNNTTHTDVSFTILGTNTDPEKTIEFRRDVIKVLTHNTITTLDPTLPLGKVVTDQAGSDGYVVNVYKIIRRAGVVEKEEFMHKDTYQILDAKVRKGTKPNPEVKKAPEQPKIEPLKSVDEPPKTDNNNQNSETDSLTESLEPVNNQEQIEPIEQ